MIELHIVCTSKAMLYVFSLYTCLTVPLLREHYIRMYVDMGHDIFLYINIIVLSLGDLRSLYWRCLQGRVAKPAKLLTW